MSLIHETIFKNSSLNINTWLSRLPLLNIPSTCIFFLAAWRVFITAEKQIFTYTTCADLNGLPPPETWLTLKKKTYTLSAFIKNLGGKIQVRLNRYHWGASIPGGRSCDRGWVLGEHVTIPVTGLSSLPRLPEQIRRPDKGARRMHFGISGFRNPASNRTKWKD